MVSIFVNPTQFGPGGRPRPISADARRRPRASAMRPGADLVFAPTEPTIYPRGRSATTFVEVPGLSHVLEGASPAGAFSRRATVVLALFEIVRPDLAVFGQKDYQQQLLIRRMVDDLHVPVEIVTEPTVREPDGLAMSSRNRYLNAERAAGGDRASPSALAAARGGRRGRARRRPGSTDSCDQTIESEASARLDYAEVADAETLEPLDEIAPGRPAVALLAARVGTTRLIDNAPSDGVRRPRSCSSRCSRASSTSRRSPGAT